MKKTIIITLFCLPAALSAQELSPTLLASSGGSFQAGNISMSFSVGELAVASLSQSGVILTQGFQQPEQTVVNVEEETAIPTWRFRVWPNPVQSDLFIEIRLKEEQDLFVETYDLLGRLHNELKLVKPLQLDPYLLDMSDLENGIYFLKVRSADHHIEETIRIRKE